MSVSEFPPVFLERMQRLLGEEFPSFAASLSEFPQNGLRVNTLKLNAADLRKISPYPLEPVPWCEEGFRLRSSHEPDGVTSPGKHPMHSAGLYYLQDISAMAAAEMLAPHPGEKVLDLSAAPGGKTTHLAARMRGKGLLVANEIHPQRVWDLAENLERWGIQNAIITHETPQRLADHFGAFFDRVLVDAPCSGEGMFRKNPGARAEWSPELVQSCAVRQSAILRTASKLVRPGGWLAYTTCTFSPEENEDIIYRFLESAASDNPFDLAQTPWFTGFAEGQPGWVTAAHSPREAQQLHRTLRLWPHHDAGEGHFLALMQRSLSGEKSSLPIFRPVLPRSVRGLIERFITENLESTPNIERISLQGAHLYQHPEEAPDLGTLHVIHPGLWWGILKKERIQPAHALAMSLKPAEALRTYTLQSEHPKLQAYLHGDSLDSPGDAGWLLVALAVPGLAETFSLGWGRRVQGQIKNFYPKGLRRP